MGHWGINLKLTIETEILKLFYKPATVQIQAKHSPLGIQTPQVWESRVDPGVRAAGS